MTLHFIAHAKAADLSSGLRFVAIAIAKKPPVAMLAGVMLTASEDGITLSAFDYEVSATITIPGSGEGSALVSHSQFVAVLKAFGKNDTITLDGDFTDGLHLDSDGFTANVDVVGNVEDYPALPGTGDEVAYLADTSLISDVLTAVCKDPALPALCGVQIRTDPADGSITMAATDSYRLVEAVSSGAHDLLDPISDIVPGRVCAHVAKMFNDGARIGSSSGMLGFADSTKSVVSRLIDAAFPRYQSIIPTEDYAAQVTADATALIAAVKRVQAAMTKSQIEQGVRVLLEPGAVTVGSLVVPAKFDGAASFETMLSPQYTIDALTAIGPGEVTISAFSPKPATPLSLRPILFANDRGVRATVMPIKPGAA